jgi:LacI family transcriptional regulator, galactose operon repressor
MPTIKDVAKLARVSYSTVSNVLTNSRPVSSKARAGVEAAIKQLNYLPSGVARSLRHRTTSTIGLLISNITNPFFAELARGIENACYRNSYSVVLCNSEDDPIREETYLRVLMERRIDGLIVGSTGDDPALSEMLKSVHCPVLLVDRPLPELRGATVQTDHERGGYLAAKHLLDLGHRAIGFIGGPLKQSPSAERLRGFLLGLREQKIKIPPGWIVEADFSVQGGYRVAHRLMGARRPTAIFAGNDMTAIGVLSFASEKKIRVPDELSVVGFDGIELGRYIKPALTTIDQSIQRLGEIAAAALIRSMLDDRAGRVPETHSIEPKLLIRGSTGPAPI